MYKSFAFMYNMHRRKQSVFMSMQETVLVVYFKKEDVFEH